MATKLAPGPPCRSVRPAVLQPARAHEAFDENDIGRIREAAREEERFGVARLRDAAEWSRQHVSPSQERVRPAPGTGLESPETRSQNRRDRALSCCQPHSGCLRDHQATSGPCPHRKFRSLFLHARIGLA
jgi:hypothetical protein